MKVFPVCFMLIRYMCGEHTYVCVRCAAAEGGRNVNEPSCRRGDQGIVSQASCLFHGDGYVIKLIKSLWSLLEKAKIVIRSQITFKPSPLSVSFFVPSAKHHRHRHRHRHQRAHHLPRHMSLLPAIFECL